MALAITHSTAADGTFSASGTTAWDAAHTLTGIASAAQGGTGIAFFTAAGPTVARTFTFPDADATIARTDAANTFTGIQTFSTPIATASVATMSATVGGGVPTPPNNTTTFLRGDGTFATPAGGASLNGITAATGAVTIASGNNTGIVWNWANTTDSTIAFTFGETSAATNGTSTNGIPNQVLLKLTTAAASTQGPLSVFSRATHVFSVSSTSPQIFMGVGSASLPTLTLVGGGGTTGLYGTVNTMSISIGGTRTFGVASGATLVPVGSASAPGLTDLNGNGDGLFMGGLVGITVQSVELARFAAAGVTLPFASASAVSYAMNFRKSRGSVASPTVITTGDDLATISGFGYVGATNTYQEACRITFDSTGTISDSATGIGGILRFLVATVGAEPVEAFQARGGGLSFPSSGGAPTVGNAVLVTGTVTVTTSAVNTADVVLLTRKTSGGTLGTAITYTISDATSFTITSDSALDTSTFSWIIIKAH